VVEIRDIRWGRTRTFDLWIAISREIPRTGPRDAVKVTGWAIRCTILWNNSERHLRRSLITLDGTESPRKDDMIVEIGEDSYDTNVKFIFVKKEKEQKDDNKTFFQKKNLGLSYTIQIVFCNTDLFFTFRPSFNFSNQLIERNFNAWLLSFLN